MARYTARHIAIITGKSIVTLLLVGLLAIVATSISPIYNFSDPQPFSGSDVFDPYRHTDSCQVWIRANLHTHTLIPTPLNECDYSAEETIEAYRTLGYDIVALTNHNYITQHPNPKQHTPAYEHGYNLLKYHKIAFGAERVMRFDHLLPVLASQRQWQIDLLNNSCQLVQLNHPLRTPLTTHDIMRKLSGYTLMELDSGLSTECEYWDEALSAGHYSFGVANDDLHHPDRTAKIARRCTFIASPTESWEDVERTLREGGFYAMRLPDYGDGDWTTKRSAQQTIPRIVKIGAEGDTLRMQLSKSAERIVIYGAAHRTLLDLSDTSSVEYVLPHDEPYARLVAHFATGEVIYTNPFARYNKLEGDYPTTNSEHSINMALTALYNLIIAAICGTIVVITLRLWRKTRD